MFLAADPLEQLAAAGAFGSDARAEDAAFALAAAWRHGMAGNSPLYLPGFFAVALAAWVFSEGAEKGTVSTFAFGLLGAFVTACAAAPVGTWHVISVFHTETGAAPTAPVPCASPRAMLAGVYTLLTWTTFVVGSRVALEQRSLLPLLPVPVLTAGLVALRPWTVDDFTTTWWQRAGQGDLVALGSAALIPLLAGYLVIRARRRRILLVLPRTSPNPGTSVRPDLTESASERLGQPAAPGDESRRGENDGVESRRIAARDKAEHRQRAQGAGGQACEFAWCVSGVGFAGVPARGVALDIATEAGQRDRQHQQSDEMGEWRHPFHKERAHQKPCWVGDAVEDQIDIPEVAANKRIECVEPQDSDEARDNRSAEQREAEPQTRSDEQECEEPRRLNRDRTRRDRPSAFARVSCIRRPIGDVVEGVDSAVEQHVEAHVEEHEFERQRPLDARRE